MSYAIIDGRKICVQTIVYISFDGHVECLSESDMSVEVRWEESSFSVKGRKRKTGNHGCHRLMNRRQWLGRFEVLQNVLRVM